MASKPLKSTCHCGAVTVTVPHLPEEINECQCTICRRYAAAWAYYKVDEVQWDIKEGAKIQKYIWGDKETAFNFCGNCGCVCYHWPFKRLENPDGSEIKFGVNTRNMDPMALFYVTRKIDNAWVLAPLNNPSEAHKDDQAGY